MDTRVSSWRQSSQGVILTTDLHLLPRFRMSRAIPVLPLYTFMMWIGTTLLYLSHMHELHRYIIFISCNQTVTWQRTFQVFLPACGSWTGDPFKL
jgi:hypothetical protein